jgi:hypothetical protein
MAYTGCTNQSSLFGASEKYIKFLNSDIVAIEGANTIERQFLKDLRIPYTQILKGRVVLKAGQVDYLLNHLGLGDNATFLSITATYDPKSKVEADNYVVYNYSDDMTKNRHFSQLMILTGNSSNRIPQLYLTNPNANYKVVLDIMVAVIDETYNYFNDTINQSGLSFTGLEYTDIHTYIVNESIVINDKSSPAKPLVYLKLTNINSIERSGLILIIDDQSYGTLFLKFLTQNDANQAFSLINYVLDNPGIDIDTISPLSDTVDPIVYFYSRVENTGDYIAFNGSTTSVPYDTSDGFTFSTSISLSTYGTQSGGGTNSVIDRNRLIYLLVDSVSDNRDGTMSLTASNLIITATAGEISTIVEAGTYSVTFDFSDLAQNYLNGVVINLTIS